MTEYIEVRLKIPAKHFNMNFSGEGAPILKYFQQTFLSAANADDSHTQMVDNITRYLHDMKNMQHMFFIFADDAVEVLPPTVAPEAFTEDDFNVG